jgi:hypothetical protein
LTADMETSLQPSWPNLAMSFETSLTQAASVLYSQAVAEVCEVAQPEVSTVALHRAIRSMFFISISLNNSRVEKLLPNSVISLCFVHWRVHD